MNASTSLAARQEVLNWIDEATAALDRGDRAEAAQRFALASERLFRAAAAAEDSTSKMALLRRAQQLLRAVALLQGQAGGGGSAAKSKLAAEDAHDVPPQADGQAGDPDDADEGPIKRLRSDLTFDDIAGLDEVKERLRLRLIYPLKHPEKLARYGLRSGGGFLLYGPPGTGKTMIARALAGELEWPFFALKPSEVLSQWFGQSEARLAAVFDEARKHPGAVIFVDEIDALGSSRESSGSNQAAKRLLTQLLQELDGVDARQGGLLFLAATNVPWELDSALVRPGRFDEKCYVPLPDAAARQKLLELQLDGVPLDRAIDLVRLAARTDGYSGADMACLCERAKQIPFREAVLNGTERPLAARDFEEAIKHIQPSVLPASLARFEAWKG